MNLPERTAVVVVGGGIIGASTALFLARDGIPTVLCEKGDIGGEQSSRNWGWVRKMGRDPRELPLAIASMHLWRELNQMVGSDTGFREAGLAFLCKTAEDIAKREAWLDCARAYDLGFRMIAGAELDRILPGSACNWAGALFTHSDGGAEPRQATLAIARAAERLGAKVVTRCAVRDIESAAGRVTAVVTEHSRIACEAVVLAGGAWSSLFCRRLNLRLPQLKVLGSVMRLAAFDGGPKVSAWGPGFAFRKRLDGGYTIAHGSANVFDIVPDSFRFFWEFLPALRLHGSELRPRIGKRFFQESLLEKPASTSVESPFERVRVLDPAPIARILRDAHQNLIEAFPIFQGHRILEQWAGLIDVTPDAIPVMSPVESLPGFFIATGFSGHGFGVAPASGRLMADLVLNRTPLVDPSPFRFQRFANRSELVATKYT